MSIFVRFGRRCAHAVLGVALAGVLAACGGGSGAGTPVLGGGTSGGTTATTASDLAVTADKVTVPNSGAESVTYTITALTAGNAALTGVEIPVTVEVDSGAIVTPSAKVTGKDTGKLTAVVQLVDKTNRTVKLTITSGSIKKTASFDVVDSVNGTKVADLAMVLDTSSIPNNGSVQANLVLTSLDNSRSAIGGTPVALKITDPGGSAFITPDGTSTNATTGQLTAKVSLGSVKTNRAITITATSGTVVRTVSFDVVDSTSIVPKANDLTMALSKNNVGNSGSDSVDVIVTAVNQSRNAVSGIKVTFAVDSNAVLVAGNLVTDANGQAKASVSIGADRSNRTVIVTATSDTLVRQAAFRVTGAKLQASLQPATLNATAPGQVEYTLTDINSAGMPDADVVVSGPGTAKGTGKTDSKGKYVYSYTASGNGPTAINATAGGAAVVSTVQINATVPVVPATTNIASVTFTASPVVVSVNTVGSTENRSELRLLFRSDKNEPVPNARARIGFGANNTSTDGDISSGKDQVVYADSNGVAVLSFIAGQRSSPTEQVKVYACYGKDDAVASIELCSAANLRTVSLTVVEQPVSISIGTDNLVGTGTNGLTYLQQFTVLVVDAAGNPKADVQVSPVIDLPSYLKGFYTFDAIAKKWNQTVTAQCINEDNAVGTGYRNGTIEAGEDINGSGQLDPRKSDVSISLVGSTKTDANGLALLRVEYPQSFGSWTEFSIRVSAPGVLSPPAWTGRLAAEGSTLASLQGTVRYTIVPISVIKAEAAPPFIVSPYGQVGSCTSPN